MRYNQLGRTGLFVSELCLGTMTFGDAPNTNGGLEQDTVDTVLSEALAAGINFIDTANVYSIGQSETLLGRSLRNLGVKRKDVLLASKVYAKMGDKPNDFGASRAHIMDSVRASLDRLQVDHLDLYQIHGNDPVTPLDETLRTLDDLRSQGLVRYVGVSNWPAWKIARSLGWSERYGWARIDSLQAYYTIAGRDIEREIVPMITEEKVGLMVWSPLAGGLLSGKFGPGSNDPENARRAKIDFPPINRDRAWACVDAMRGIAKAHDVSVARIAIAWLLAKPHVSTVIIGAKTTAQLADNIAATAVTLTADDMTKLDAVSELPSEYPGWMIARQAGYRRPPPFKPAS